MTLDEDFIKYMIEKTDHYMEKFIETNWNPEKNAMESDKGKILTNIGVFKLKLKKMLGGEPWSES